MVDSSQVAKEAQGQNGRAADSNGPERLADSPIAAMKQAWSAVGKHLPEMREDLLCQASVQVDRVRLAASQALTGVASSLLQFLAVAVVLATAMSLLLVGAAGGLAVALHGNVWLANLITGSAALLVLWSAIALVARNSKRQRMRRLQRRYRRHEAGDRHLASAELPGGRKHAERS